MNKVDNDIRARAILRDMGFNTSDLTTGDLAPLRNLIAVARNEAGLDPDLTKEIHIQMARAAEALIRLSNAVTARAINIEVGLKGD